MEGCVRAWSANIGSLLGSNGTLRGCPAIRCWEPFVIEVFVSEPWNDIFDGLLSWLALNALRAIRQHASTKIELSAVRLPAGSIDRSVVVAVDGPEAHEI